MKQTRSLVSNILAVTAICGAGILVYLNTFHSPFTFDDINITRNVYITNLKDLKAIWNCSPTRFVTYLSFAINYYFNGMQVTGYHIVNLTIHLLSAIFVRWFIMLTFTTPAVRDMEIAEHAGLISFFGALLFVVHPVQTEAVTYIYQRATSLAALFYLASLCFYIKARFARGYGSGTGWFFYGSSVVTALVGMFTKEIVATLPLMILLYEFCFFRVEKRLNWKYVVPFLIMLAVIPLTLIYSGTGQAELLRKIAGGSIGIPRECYFFTQLRVLVTYLRLLFVPLNQNLVYDYPVCESLWERPALAGGCAVLVILLTGILLFKKYRLISFSIFWFFLTLSVESSIIPLVWVMFEHRLYLPMVAYSIFLPTMLCYLCRRKMKFVTVIMLVIISFYGILAYSRNRVWRNQLLLWEDTVRKSPGNPIALANLGNAYARNGMLDIAIKMHKKAILIVPDFAGYHTDLGWDYARKGLYEKAKDRLKIALKLNSSCALAHYRLGIIYQLEENYEDAIREFEEAVMLNPSLIMSHYRLGFACQRKGDLRQAMYHYGEAIMLDPSNVKALNNLGCIYFRTGMFGEAKTAWEKALAVDPGFKIVKDNLEMLDNL
jgi:Flp pilus assembly protein TadD